MSDPVTKFMLVVSGLLVVGSVGEQIFARTGVPAVIWLILLGVIGNVAGVVPGAVVTELAPFFAALALVLILFDGGRHLTVGTGSEAVAPVIRRRALLLALFGFAGTTVLVALLSMGLWGLNILPVWSWTHAFMLGSLISAGAGEVFVPSLVAAGVDAGSLTLLRREAAISKALAVIGTVLCVDLLSPHVATGDAALTLVAAFGFALAFGSVAGMAWIAALQRLADNPRSYLYTLAMMIALYVLSESAGGSGPLSVLVFGVTLGNAGGLLGLLRRKGEVVDPAAAGVVHAALADHEGTIQFVRTLVFALVGLMLAPPWGPLVMGVALGFLPLVVRLLVVRFVLAGSDHEVRSTLGNCAPRGMATVALATLPLAHAVPGAAAMLTLVFSAVTTSIVLFTLGQRHGRAVVAPAVDLSEQPAEPAKPAVVRTLAPSFAPVDVRAPTMQERRSEPGETGRSTPVELLLEMDGLLPAMTPEVARPLATAPTRTLVAEPVKVAVDEPAPKAAPAPRAPLVGMQELPTPSAGPKGRTPEVYMPTLPTIDAARAHGENPLDSAMARALGKRPPEPSAVKRRTTGDFETPPPSFAKFEGASEDDATQVLERIGAGDEKV